LAPDHVHVYLESDGEKSIETIVKEVKRLSEITVVARDSDEVQNTAAGNYLWDRAYFVETIG
jgi:REP element-mobilizing transposase RayT